MEQVNVLVTFKIGERLCGQITSIDPRVNLIYGADMAASERDNNVKSKENLDTLLSDVEILICDWPLNNIISRAPRLRWIHSMLAGVDQVKYADVFHSPVMLTNSRGIHGPQMSELTFEMMLMLAKQAERTMSNKQAKKWDHFLPSMLYSKTLGLIGIGHVGQNVARLAKAFHMRVIAVRRSHKKTGTRNVDEMLNLDQLSKLLAMSDYVVLALPATSESIKMIGERELRIMKSSAYLINIARGSLVDEEALIKAIESNWIAGAGLDVFENEPLPVSSKLWQLPNVIINPHMGGIKENYHSVAVKKFCDNLQRYLSGKKLLNVVDKKKGY